MTAACWPNTSRMPGTRAPQLSKKFRGCGRRFELAIKEGRLQFNPFAEVVAER